MTAVLFCLAAFVITYWAGRVSLIAGIITSIAIGYCYGILRANLLQGAAHFIFDASLAALYLSVFTSKSTVEDKTRSQTLTTWLVILIAWPTLLLFLPFQPFLVSLVGLRGNTFFLPVLALGARLKNSDITKLCYALGLMNLVAFGFGVAEYFLGIERFFPLSAVTSIMYASSDAGGGHHRIPSIFSSAHAYAATMVYTLPWLLGAWAKKQDLRLWTIVIFGGLLSALGGIMLASTRMNVVTGGIIVTIAIFAGSMNMKHKILWVGLLVIAVMLATTNERFSRFKRLDSDTITERVSGSVSRTFVEILYEYPMGNGLGGGGTSLPYFLMGLVHNPTVVENEYGRILLEEGIIGLLIWICFISWVIFNRKPFIKTKWLVIRRLSFAMVVIYFGITVIGLGMLTAIPGTFMFFLTIGWIVTKPASDTAQALLGTASHPARRNVAVADGAGGRPTLPAPASI